MARAAAARPAPRLAEDSGVDPIDSPSLTDIVYRQIRESLMRGRLKPHQRLKVRSLATSFGVSETPVREAIFQLARERAIEIKPRCYIRVRRLSLAEYLEQRDIRLQLEPLAAERAMPALDSAALEGLARIHAELEAAERSNDFDTALQRNFDFHFGIYRRSNMPTLISTLETLWIQVGPMLNYLYPFGRPTYDAGHQHERIMDALRRQDRDALWNAVRQDMIEGGRNFVRHLESYEREQALADETAGAA